jgi:VWFA-related protein
LGEQLDEIPGPKTIVWISRGAQNWPDYRYGCHDLIFPVGASSYVAGKCTHKCNGYYPCVDYVPFFRHFTSELNQSNTIMYNAEMTREHFAPFTDRGTCADTLRQLASLTGGRMYVANSVEQAITDSIRNARARYQLVYTAPPPNGKYHKLRVTCARNGVRLEFPRGYYADEP